MLLIIETRPTGDITQEISPDMLPATIGRWSGATYPVAQGIEIPKGRPLSALERFAGNISRVHVTLYRNYDDLFLKDGGSKPSSNGIFRNGRVLREPTRLYPGMSPIYLCPDAGDGFSLYITYPADKPKITPEETPTLQRMTEARNAPVLTINPGDALQELEQTLTQIGEEHNKAIADCDLNVVRMGDRVKELDDEISDLRQSFAKERNLNARINQRQTRWILGFSAASIFITWFMLGGDKDQIETLGRFLLVAINAIVSILAALDNFEKIKFLGLSENDD